MNFGIDLQNSNVKRAISMLEKMDSIVAIDRANLLLVAAGKKPAMHTGFFTEWVEVGHGILDVDIKIKNDIVDCITDLGLAYKLEIAEYTKQKDGRTYYSDLIVFCAAKEQRIVDALYDARQRQDDRAEGILLGYPETAVEAFVSDNPKEFDSIPEYTDTVTSDEMKLLNHRLSKEHWQEEISYLPEYAKFIKAISIDIYNQCLG